MIARVNIGESNGKLGLRPTNLAAKVSESVNGPDRARSDGFSSVADSVSPSLKFAALGVTVKPCNLDQFDQTDALKTGIAITGDCLTGIAGATLKLIAQEDHIIASMSDGQGNTCQLPVETKTLEGFDPGSGPARHQLQLPDGSHLQIRDLGVGQIMLSRSSDPTHFNNSLGANLIWSGSEFDLRQVSLSTNGVGAIAVLDDPLTSTQAPRIIQNTKEDGYNVQRRFDANSIESKDLDSGRRKNEDPKTTAEILSQTVSQILASNETLLTPRKGL